MKMLEGDKNNLEITPLDFLEAVMLNPNLPLTMRMRAATEAAKYRHGRMSAVAVGHFDGQSFAEALERAIKRSEAPLPLPAPGPVIEHDPEELKGPMARLDRRFG
jgi:hypothetical protein